MADPPTHSAPECDSLGYVLEVQHPWSNLILTGDKSIETRRYPLPPCLIGRPIGLLESEPSDRALPDRVELRGGDDEGKIRPRLVGTVVFSECLKYDDVRRWDADLERHRVPKDSRYTFREGGDPIYGWVVSSVTPDCDAVNAGGEVLVRVFRSVFVRSVEVPTVDLSRPDAARLVEEQCRALGFLRVTWPSFPVEAVERAHRVAAAYFALPTEVKCRYSKGAVSKTNGSFCSTGYRGMGGSLYNVGGRETYSCVRPDYDNSEECAEDEYYCGEEGMKHFSLRPDPQVPWPTEEDAPDFRETITEFYSVVEGLSERLFRTFAEVLGLESRDALLDVARRHTSALSLSNLMLGHEGEVVVPGHADITAFTILSHDPSRDASGTACLQVLSEGRWADLAPPKDGDPPSFLVNLGQIMERWSNGTLKATLHRVVRNDLSTTSGKRRQCFVYFRNTDYDTVLRPLAKAANGAGAVDGDRGEGKGRYQPEVMADYAQKRLAAFYTDVPVREAFAIYNKDVISRMDYLKLL